jgi:hypothetical protein
VPPDTHGGEPTRSFPRTAPCTQTLMMLRDSPQYGQDLSIHPFIQRSQNTLPHLLHLYRVLTPESHFGQIFAICAPRFCANHCIARGDSKCKVKP